jgi:Zn-dependent peptidase ImmA (M78 family)/predicted secreted protein
MKDRRIAILEGAKAAAKLHLQFDMRSYVENHGGSIDVFGTILKQQIPLMFRPLDALLGLYLPEPGILVTTQRTLSIQRWTAAHELGHASMHHEASFDDESLLTRVATATATYQPVEIAADSFATHFLLPKWLFVANAARHKWTKKDLLNPLITYQLSLRVGASYQGTCMALHRHQLITQNELNRLMVVEVKSIKQHLLAGYQLENWYPDVWLLTETDEGTSIEGDSRDAFVIQLQEKTGSGYIWNIDDLNAAGFVLFQDQRVPLSTEAEVGGPMRRVLGARPGTSRFGRIALTQNRPWQKAAQAVDRLSFTFDLRGKESGRPRAIRRSWAAA